MKLLEVIHAPEYLAKTIGCINELFLDSPPESMMLELPSNWEDIGIFQRASEGFFYPLSLIYGRKGTKIIYGDVNRTPDELRWDTVSSMLFRKKIRERDEFMINSIRENNPSIVVVGRAHADEFKKVFPEAYYVAFEDWIAKYDGKLANKVINLSC